MTEHKEPSEGEGSASPTPSPEDTPSAADGRSVVIEDLLRLIAELQQRTAAHDRKLKELQAVLTYPAPKLK